MQLEVDIVKMPFKNEFINLFILILIVKNYLNYFCIYYIECEIL